MTAAGLQYRTQVDRMIGTYTRRSSHTRRIIHSHDGLSLLNSSEPTPRNDFPLNPLSPLFLLLGAVIAEHVVHLFQSRQTRNKSAMVPP